MNRREFLEINAAAAGLCAAQAEVAGRAAMKAGFAETEITPKVDPKRVHDPLKVRAAVFDDGAMRVALAGVDLIGVPREIVASARKDIQAACNIAPDAVLVGASHTHSAGPDARSDPDYAAFVSRQIAAAVIKADSARSEARCGAGSGFENQVAFNRRLRMKSGLTYTHPGVGNPDMLGFAGPTDPEVGVIGAWNTDGKLIGCIVTYACHATTSPPGISANWIYYMERIVRGIEPSAVVVFLQGACGDVTHVNNLSPYAMPSGDEYAHFVGQRVGAEAVKVLSTMHPGRLAPLAARSKVWPIKYRVPSSDRVRRAKEVAQLGPGKADPTELWFSRPVLGLVDRLAKNDSEQVEVQVVQVGPAVFVSNPAELFCQFGLDIKEGSPFHFTWPVELANGSVGYVPTEEAFGPNGGGYETHIGVSRLDLTAGRQMVEAGLELARQLHPGPVPMPPKSPPFRTTPGNIGPQLWTLGTAPPEVS